MKTLLVITMASIPFQSTQADTTLTRQTDEGKIVNYQIPEILYPIDKLTKNKEHTHPLAEINPNTEGETETYIQSLKNKDIDNLINIKALKDNTTSTKRKNIAKTYFDEFSTNKDFPGIQKFNEYLIKENLNTKPGLDFFLLNASTRFNSDETSEGTPRSLKNSLIDITPTAPDNEPVTRKLRIREDQMHTTNGGNTAPLYGKNYTFKNERSGYSASLPSTESERMRKESSDCEGNKKKSGDTEYDKKNVYRCFKIFNENLYSAMNYNYPEYLEYLQTLPLLTSLIDSTGKHVCMASYYQKDKWITSSHCVTEDLINLGLSIIASGKKVAIQRSQIKDCAESKGTCDVAFITAPTPSVELSNIRIQHGSTKDLKENSRIFIPGIEYLTKITVEKEINFSNVLMWADVGKGYCRIYKVENGCFSHTCSTLTGFSGSPVYWVNDSDKKLQLIGVHSGDFKDVVACKDSGTNYAVSNDLYED